jgi:hypothetical protein
VPFANANNNYTQSGSTDSTDSTDSTRWIECETAVVFPDGLCVKTPGLVTTYAVRFEPLGCRLASKEGGVEGRMEGWMEGLHVI